MRENRTCLSRSYPAHAYVHGLGSELCEQCVAQATESVLCQAVWSGRVPTTSYRLEDNPLLNIPLRRRVNKVDSLSRISLPPDFAEEKPCGRRSNRRRGGKQEKLAVLRKLAGFQLA